MSAVSFSDSPLSTEEPLDLTDITSAESRFAASSKLRRRARRGLEEEVDDRPAAERRQLLHLALERALEDARGREQPRDVVASEVADRDQVPARRRVGRREQVVADELNASLAPPRGRAGRGRPRRSRRAAPGRARRARWAGSCRRSRGGSGARGGRGRRRRRAGRGRAGRSRSSASIAARIVRPV